MLDPCSGKGSVKGIWTRESTLTHSLKGHISLNKTIGCCMSLKIGATEVKCSQHVQKLTTTLTTLQSNPTRSSSINILKLTLTIN